MSGISLKRYYPGFHIWLPAHDQWAAFFVILLIFVLIQRFASRFQCATFAFFTHEKYFDANQRDAGLD
jgi:hypothetical protein